ncbi:MAG: cation-transporting P-type ATPase [Candidatus Gracilibacteria bacterium]|jgi:Ca2+-transporting ATPase|nr:cation-transporting P-type ATPase [Candidatus Gracilibacteria bacterium]
MKQKGLSKKEVSRLKEKYGLNEIPKKKEYRAFKIFLNQVSSWLIIILFLAGLTSFLMGERLDAYAILSIVAINAIIGFIQEYKAEKAIESLKKLVISTATVIRDGTQIQINSKDLVPGDIVILQEGEKIQADMEMLESFSLSVDESILTGESETVQKKIGEEIFKGTLITSGRGIAMVKSIGEKTEFGKIIKFLGKETDNTTPLSIQLESLGKKLGLLIISIIAVLLILGLFRGIDFSNMFFIAISLGVSAIPEGLPIIVTLTLALSVQSLARKNAIVRKMKAIEGLGATTVICSDKTGTLTLNEMTLEKIYTNFEEFSVKGVGYETRPLQKKPASLPQKLIEIATNCNNAFLGKNLIGDPTEIALKVMAIKFGEKNEIEKLDEIAFTSERKMMSTLHQMKKGKEVFAKGAFEEIIKRCKYILVNGEIKKITKPEINRLKEHVEKYSRQALRTLALAYKPFDKEYSEDNLIFTGLTALKDPPRKSAKKSLQIALNAGIKIKIITGDHALTAKSIGEQLGLKNLNIVTGDELDGLSDIRLLELIKKTQIFARTKPEHKFRIVNLLKKDGEIVAVTGDGVNDAPALKHADVGIAMGIKGSEATKEVADIILRDDNFSTIVKTIEEGRRIYKNILSFIKFLLSANFDSLSTVAVLTILNLPLPLLPLQILWINLATDGLPALALGTTSRKDENIMKEPPHPKKENILGKFISFILTAAILQTIINLLIYFYGKHLDFINNINTADLTLPSFARTMVFTQIILFELVFVFICKEEKKITIKTFTSDKKILLAVFVSLILNLTIIYTPIFQNIFKTKALGLSEWIIIILGSLSALIVPFIDKIFKNLYGKFFKKKDIIKTT